MEYSDKDIALSKLNRNNKVSGAGSRGRGFFSDVDSKSARGPKSESLSRKTLNHIQGHGGTTEHAAQKPMAHMDSARKQRKAMNLKPGAVNPTRFKT